MNFQVFLLYGLYWETLSSSSEYQYWQHKQNRSTERITFQGFVQLSWKTKQGLSQEKVHLQFSKVVHYRMTKLKFDLNNQDKNLG